MKTVIMICAGLAIGLMAPLAVSVPVAFLILVMVIVTRGRPE